MLEDPITVIIGGVTYLCPPMPFYCLERAWPHIQKMGRMGAANQALAAAQLQVRMAGTQGEHDAATQAVASASALVEAEDADFIGQTREALHVVVAALALDANPPSYETLSRRLLPGELAGVHIACTELMDSSGLVKVSVLGEAVATSQPAGLLNGSGSSPN